jgi:hypothetical protein
MLNYALKGCYSSRKQMCPCSKAKKSVTDVLEDKRHLRLANLCPQQVIMIVFEFGIREVVPPNQNAPLTRNSSVVPDRKDLRAGIPIEQCR